jgi:hypothetical protein
MTTEQTDYYSKYLRGDLMGRVLDGLGMSEE